MKNPINRMTGFLILLVIILLAFHLSATNLEYSRYNPSWNGTSAFFSYLEETPGYIEIRESRDILSYNSSVLFIIGVEGGFSSDEIRNYRRYAEQGNTIVIADDNGGSNVLLEGIGSTIRIIPGNLTSIGRVYDDSTSVLAFPTTTNVPFSDNGQILLNKPGYTSGGVPLFTTSLLSWIDSNGNERPDPEEELGRYPVLTSEKIGKGRVYVFSDPSVFINGMWQGGSWPGNIALIEDFAGSGSPVLIDQVHGNTGSADGVIPLINFIKDSILLRLAILLLVVGCAACIFRVKRKMVDL
jgi:hypothetical protein